MNKAEKRIRKETFANVEEEFFEIDKENRIATIRLSFDKVSDIFDDNYITKKPILNGDFMEWIANAFSIIPSRYKIKLSVSFADYEGYSEGQLKELFLKNIILYAKSKHGYQKKRNSLAYGLIAVGIAFFIGMLFTELRWETESVLKTIFSYVSDIATTVAFWEAMTILIVERREQHSYIVTVEKRFSGVEFGSK